MLSQSQMVSARCAIERSYIGFCTIVEQKKVQNANKSTGFQEVIVLENQPCKLSFSSVKSVSENGVGATVTQTTKVFLSPEIKVKTGSKLIITQNGVVAEYQNSGEPATFFTHQEIGIQLFERWS